MEIPKVFGNFVIFLAYTYINTKNAIDRRLFILDNMDINKILAAISKMDKEELEKNLYKAQKILENTNLKKEDK